MIPAASLTHPPLPVRTQRTHIAYPSELGGLRAGRWDCKCRVGARSALQVPHIHHVRNPQRPRCMIPASIRILRTPHPFRITQRQPLRSPAPPASPTHPVRNPQRPTRIPAPITQPTAPTASLPKPTMASAYTLHPNSHNHNERSFAVPRIRTQPTATHAPSASNNGPCVSTASLTHPYAHIPHHKAALEVPRMPHGRYAVPPHTTHPPHQPRPVRTLRIRHATGNAVWKKLHHDHPNITCASTAHTTYLGEFGGLRNPKCPSRNPQRPCTIPAPLRITRVHTTTLAYPPHTLENLEDYVIPSAGLPHPVRIHRISSETHNGVCGRLHTPSQLPQPQRPMRITHIPYAPIRNPQRHCMIPASRTQPASIRAPRIPHTSHNEQCVSTAPLTHPPRPVRTHRTPWRFGGLRNHKCRAGRWDCKCRVGARSASRVPHIRHVRILRIQHAGPPHLFRNPQQMTDQAIPSYLTHHTTANASAASTAARTHPPHLFRNPQ